jgi:hypothetical protein
MFNSPGLQESGVAGQGHLFLKVLATVDCHNLWRDHIFIILQSLVLSYWPQ